MKRASLSRVLYGGGAGKVNRGKGKAWDAI